MLNLSMALLDRESVVLAIRFVLVFSLRVLILPLRVCSLFLNCSHLPSKAIQFLSSGSAHCCVHAQQDCREVLCQRQPFGVMTDIDYLLLANI